LKFDAKRMKKGMVKDIGSEKRNEMNEWYSIMWRMRICSVVLYYYTMTIMATAICLLALPNFHCLWIQIMDFSSFLFFFQITNITYGPSYSMKRKIYSPIIFILLLLLVHKF
jgi:hypothetical protein